MPREIWVTCGGMPIPGGTFQVSDAELAEGLRKNISAILPPEFNAGRSETYRWDGGVEIVRLKNSAPCGVLVWEDGTGISRSSGWYSNFGFSLKKATTVERFPPKFEGDNPPYFFSTSLCLREVSNLSVEKAQISIDGCAEFRLVQNEVESWVKVRTDITIVEGGGPVYPLGADKIGKGMVLLETIDLSPTSRVLVYGIPKATHFRIDTLWSDGRKVRGETLPVSELLAGYHHTYNRESET